ncbi:MAG: hypothetical protein KatS3mg123_0285 [Burkholderiales bacterium]|nr:MAG: hypothetical protein KatS3mg123_0285 [Burkholderiales bacterium]
MRKEDTWHDPELDDAFFERAELRKVSLTVRHPELLRLTSSEIESLRRDLKESLAYAKKVYFPSLKIRGEE